MDPKVLFQRLVAQYDVVEQTVEVGLNEGIRLLAVRDTDVLLDQIDPEEFKRDERLPYWAEVWPAGIGLARYLVAHPVGRDEVVSFPKVASLPRVVLDLGCGMGLVGIAAAKMGARVVMCDYEPDALVFARYNAGLNDVVERMTFRLLDWRCPDLEGTFRTILGSDILYEQKDHDYLEAFVERFLEPGGLLLISDPDRKWGERFVTRLRDKGYGHIQTRMCVIFEGRTEQGTKAVTCRVNVHRLVRPDE